MKLTKSEVCVYISNEAQLQEARELLERYGEGISEQYFYLSRQSEMNYLQLDMIFNWSLFDNDDKQYTKITLQELETILKEQ